MRLVAITFLALPNLGTELLIAAGVVAALGLAALAVGLWWLFGKGPRRGRVYRRARQLLHLGWGVGRGSGSQLGARRWRQRGRACFVEQGGDALLEGTGCQASELLRRTAKACPAEQVGRRPGIPLHGLLRPGWSELKHSEALPYVRSR